MLLYSFFKIYYNVKLKCTYDDNDDDDVYVFVRAIVTQIKSHIDQYTDITSIRKECAYTYGMMFYSQKKGLCQFLNRIFTTNFGNVKMTNSGNYLFSSTRNRIYDFNLYKYIFLHTCYKKKYCFNRLTQQRPVAFPPSQQLTLPNFNMR